jgi:POT family proton-dependent oligopeptide transporter
LAEDELTRNKAMKIENQPLTRRQWQAILGLGALMLLNVTFWAVYEQQGNTIQLFADANTDWHIFGWKMPSTWFQSINPAFIFIFVPLLNMLWTRQSKRNTEPSSVAKMAIGCSALGLSFIVLIAAANGLGATDRISCLWLVGCTLIYTIGELYVSPIGLSLVTKVAPPRLVGMLMGAWYLAVFFGNYLSGYIGSFYEKMPKETFFLLLASLGLLSGFAIFTLKKPLKGAIGQTA